VPSGGAVTGRKELIARGPRLPGNIRRAPDLHGSLAKTARFNGSDAMVVLFLCQQRRQAGIELNSALSCRRRSTDAVILQAAQNFWTYGHGVRAAYSILKLEEGWAPAVHATWPRPHARAPWRPSKL
jgi:hypothetical protein